MAITALSFMPWCNGKVLGMKEGVPMETKDGQVIMMKGNEIWRKTSTEKQWEELFRGP